jgi:hypothetical protein
MQNRAQLRHSAVDLMNDGWNGKSRNTQHGLLWTCAFEMDLYWSHTDRIEVLLLVIYLCLSRKPHLQEPKIEGLL